MIQAGGLHNEQSLLDGRDLGINAAQPLLQFGPALDRLGCSAPVTGFFRRPLMDSNYRPTAQKAAALYAQIHCSDWVAGGAGWLVSAKISADLISPEQAALNPMRTTPWAAFSPLDLLNLAIFCS